MCARSSPLLLLLAAFLLDSTAGDTCKGCLNFDEHSFNKIVPKFKHTLIKYDIAFPYGPRHDAFVQFAETLTDAKDLVVADVGIKDYGQKDNEAFAKAQNVDTTKLPVIKLYRGLKESHTFVGEDVTVEKLREFVVENSDVHLTLPGCVEDLDKLAAKFVLESDKKLVKQVEDYETDNETHLKAKKVYAIYMKKLLDDTDFVAKEHKRLKKILAEGKLAEGKKQDLQNKINILYSFQNKAKEAQHKNEL